MKPYTPEETIKYLIPVLSKKEKEEIQAYYTVYEKYSDDFSTKATEDLKNHPVFGKLIQGIPKEVAKARNAVSMALQKDAIVNDNWQPYIEYQIEQGITYAKMGLSFKSWYEVISLVRNYLTPYLQKEYGSGAESLSAINGMNNFMDIAMGILGEAYMQEKEEILRSNETKLKQAQAIAHLGSWAIDFVNNIGTWSEELCRIHGLLPNENKQSFESWLSFIHPEDIEYVKKEIEKSNASLSDTILNHRIIRKDGMVRNIYSISKFVLNHEGSPIGLYGISHDVTEQKIAEEIIKKQNEELEQKVIERTTQLEHKMNQLKKSEEKLEIQNSLLISTITSYKDILIFSINKDYQYLIFNEAFKSATYQAYGTEVIKGNSMLDSITNEDDRGKAKNNCDKALAGESHVTLEVFGDLTLYYYETKYNPITDDKGQVIGVTVMSANVTERIRAEQQLVELNKELESFTYSVSHDLRAPLRAVNGYAQMLNEDYGTKLDEEGKRIIETIRYNAIKMGILIDELLAFSQLGRKEVKRTKINMNELVESVFKDLNQSFTHNAEIKIGKLHHMEADYSLLRQVILNLVSNALKYSSKKEHPIVEIFSKKTDEEIVFSVKDNGAGFNMKYYDKLFGVFQRLHKQSEFDGVGVGLAIVQRVITKHGGKVWAEGKVNEGAQFNFSLTIN